MFLRYHNNTIVLSITVSQLTTTSSYDSCRYSMVLFPIGIINCSSHVLLQVDVAFYVMIISIRIQTPHIYVSLSIFTYRKNIWENSQVPAASMSNMLKFIIFVCILIKYCMCFDIYLSGVIKCVQFYNKIIFITNFIRIHIFYFYNNKHIFINIDTTFITKYTNFIKINKNPVRDLSVPRLFDTNLLALYVLLLLKTRLKYTYT